MLREVSLPPYISGHTHLFFLIYEVISFLQNLSQYLKLNLCIQRGWPRITELTRIMDRQHSLSTSAKNTHVFPGSLAFQWAHAHCHISNKRRDIAGYLKACWHTPTTNDSAPWEREKTIFSNDIKRMKMWEPMSSAGGVKKEKKASVWRRTLGYRQTVCYWIFGKN